MADWFEDCVFTTIIAMLCGAMPKEVQKELLISNSNVFDK